MSDSIPKRNRIDPPDLGTNTPTKRICSLSGQKMIDSTNEDTTVDNAINQEPKCMDDMPEPVLEEILKNLPLRDLKMAVLVCIKWRREGERPDLWKGSLFRLHNRDEIKNLSIERLKHLEKIDIHVHVDWDDFPWDTFFEVTLSLSRLKEISGLRKYFIHSVDPEILSEALAKLEIVDLRWTQITEDQAKQLFKKIYQKKNDLTDVDKSVDEEEAPRQKTGLKVLKLYRNNLSSVEPMMMGKGVSGLEEVDLGFSSLTAPQVQELFVQMNQGTQLKVLYLSENDLSSVHPRLVGKALARMKEVKLHDTSLTTAQVQEMFEQMSQNTQLEVLDLSDNDLSSVDAGVLATVVTKMSDVNLSHTEITHYQQLALLAAICEDGDIKLKGLDLGDHDLSSLDPEVLSKAVHRLEDVRLENTYLTREQYDRIESDANKQSKLKEFFSWTPYGGFNCTVDMFQEDENESDYVDEDVDEDVDVEGEEIDMKG